MIETKEHSAFYAWKFQVQEDKDSEQVVLLAREQAALKKKWDFQEDHIAKPMNALLEGQTPKKGKGKKKKLSLISG